ncbi:MAG TPA: SIS domain-containing protein [Terriglobales bacterium]|nr:SIS domain-containing protein [Terriglobales bacterium]
MNSITQCRPYFELLSKTIRSLPFEQVERVSEILVRAYEQQRTIFLFGNGGSAALASHFACDLSKGTVNGSTKRFRVMALTDNVPLMTAWANDSKYEDIFAEQLANFATRGDVALAISASGNSLNVIKALKVAKQAGSVTAGLTGFAGGRMLALCDACIVVPCDNMQIIEDLHLCVTHSLFTCIRSRICNGNTGHIALGPRLVKRTAVR